MIYSKIFFLVLILSGLFNFDDCNTGLSSHYIQEKSGIIEYPSSQDFDNKVIKIHYYIPEGDVSKMSIQMVLHGASRNASEYLDGWKEKSKLYNLIILAPEFSKEDFSIGTYTQGNFLDTLGRIQEKEKTLYHLIDLLFVFSKEKLSLQHKAYNIFGHSAGGQFVHRFLQFYDSPYLQKSVAANPGWYTYPDEGDTYPYGIEGLFNDPMSVKKNYYSKDLLILLGTADTLRTANLRKNKEADLQGLNRLERGINYFENNRKMAMENKLKFNWQLEWVPDAGHDHTLMSSAAADFLYKKP